MASCGSAIAYLCEGISHVASENQVVDDADDASRRRRRGFSSSPILARAGKVEGLVPAQQAPRQELIVEVERCRLQVRLCPVSHGGNKVGSPDGRGSRRATEARPVNLAADLGR